MPEFDMHRKLYNTVINDFTPRIYIFTTRIFKKMNINDIIVFKHTKFILVLKKVLSTEIPPIKKSSFHRVICTSSRYKAQYTNEQQSTLGNQCLTIHFQVLSSLKLLAWNNLGIQNVIRY